MPVEQQDRDAAADYMRGSIAMQCRAPFRLAIREGKMDGHALVEAFAAHRVAAIEADRRGRTFSPDEVMLAEQRGYDRAIEQVVAWLEEFGNHPPAPNCERCNAAAAISAGEHRKDG